MMRKTSEVDRAISQYEAKREGFVCELLDTIKLSLDPEMVVFTASQYERLSKELGELFTGERGRILREYLDVIERCIHT
jgi:hypothetical protein